MNSWEETKNKFVTEWDITLEIGSITSMIAMVDSQIESLTRHNVLRNEDVSSALLRINNQQKDLLEAYLEDLNELRNNV